MLDVRLLKLRAGSDYQFCGFHNLPNQQFYNDLTLPKLWTHTRPAETIIWEQNFSDRCYLLHDIFSFIWNYYLDGLIHMFQLHDSLTLYRLMHLQLFHKLNRGALVCHELEMYSVFFREGFQKKNNGIFH